MTGSRRIADMDAQTAAAYLYDGGWRDGDGEDLQEMYGLSEEESAEVCEWLKVMEEDRA